MSHGHNGTPLHHFKQGDRITIIKLDIQGTMKRRLLDLGFVPGAIVNVLKRSPLGDPTAFRVSHTTVALRKEECSNIFGELIVGDLNE